MVAGRWVREQIGQLNPIRGIGCLGIRGIDGLFPEVDIKEKAVDTERAGAEGGGPRELAEEREIPSQGS